MASWSNCRADKHHSSSTEAFRRTGGIIYMQIKLHICILASIRRQQCTQILTNESNGLFSYKEPNSAFSVCHHDPKQRISASSTRQLFSPIIWTCWHHTFWPFIERAVRWSERTALAPPALGSRFCVGLKLRLEATSFWDSTQPNPAASPKIWGPEHNLRTEAIFCFGKFLLYVIDYWLELAGWGLNDPPAKININAFTCPCREGCCG